MRRSTTTRWGRCLMYATALAATVTAAGCQVDVSGQTLPSPYWHDDDIQYFPAGPEAPLPRESAALEAFASGGEADLP